MNDEQNALVKTALKQFLDADGRLTKYPAKQKPKLMALFYLADKFEADRIYTEKEVNAILNEWHTFGDHSMLRRDLYDRHFLGRERDCSRYWLEETQPSLTI